MSEEESTKRCIQTPLGERICLESDALPMGTPHSKIVIGVSFGIGLLLLAFLTGLGMDIIALIACVGGFLLTILSIYLAFLVFSYRIWIGFVFSIGIGIGLYFLWMFLIIPSWFVLGNSLVIAFQNFIGIITP